MTKKIVGGGLIIGLESIFSPTQEARFIEKQDMPRIMKVEVSQGEEEK